MKTNVKILSLAGCILLMMACSKSDPFYEEGNPAIEKSAATEFVAGTIYQLQGLSLYKTWAVIGGTVLQETSVPCTGEIEFLGGRDFRFSFQELQPNFNAATYYGKISASGVLNFHFPVPFFNLPDGTPIYITDIIKSHGCITKLWGPGINKNTLYFKGRFDGISLTAEAMFMATTVSEGCVGLNFAYDGDVHWTFAYDMTVVGD